MVETPEGAAYYFADAADQAAVRLVADAEEIPPDLDFDELETFETARVAAERVRLDLWKMLRGAWSATWGEALASFVHARPFTLGEHEDCLGDGDDYSPTVETAWDVGWSGWGYHWNRGVLLTGVRLDEVGRLSLIVYAADAKGRTDPRLDELGGAWARDEEEWLVWASEVKVSAQMDLSAMAAALEMVAHLSFHSGA
jgi:hypothetical protein